MAEVWTEGDIKTPCGHPIQLIGNTFKVGQRNVFLHTTHSDLMELIGRRWLLAYVALKGVESS